MRYLVQRGAYLQVPHQEAGTGKWRLSTTVKGAVVPMDVPVDVLAPFVASGHLRVITDDEAARLPRALDPWLGALENAAARMQGRRAAAV